MNLLLVYLLHADEILLLLLFDHELDQNLRTAAVRFSFNPCAGACVTAIVTLPLSFPIAVVSINGFHEQSNAYRSFDENLPMVPI